jgi:hypothetical protein
MIGFRACLGRKSVEGVALGLDLVAVEVPVDHRHIHADAITSTG